jgi:hypothetical protein
MEKPPIPSRNEAADSSALLMFNKSTIAAYSVSGAALGWGAGYGALNILERPSMQQRNSLQDEIDAIQKLPPTPKTASQHQALTVAKEPYDHLTHEYTDAGASIGGAVGLTAMVTVLAVRKIKGYRIVPKDPLWEYRFRSR